MSDIARHSARKIYRTLTSSPEDEGRTNDSPSERMRHITTVKAYIAVCLPDSPSTPPEDGKTAECHPEPVSPSAGQDIEMQDTEQEQTEGTEPEEQGEDQTK